MYILVNRKGQPTKHRFYGYCVLRGPEEHVLGYAELWQCLETGDYRHFGLLEGGPQNLHGYGESEFVWQEAKREAS